MKSNEEMGGNKSRIYIAVIIAIIGVILSIIAITSYFHTYAKYPYGTVIGGVRIDSNIPLEDVQTLKTIALLNSSNNAATTCNFELSAISIRGQNSRSFDTRGAESNPDRMGYLVKIENGKKGVHIDQGTAYIRGETDDEILDACHAFACIRDGIKCPDNFKEVRDIMLNSDQMNLILDSNVTGEGIRAYAEIMGALGYLQAVLVDYDKDDVIEQTEVNKNSVWIYPYIREEENCILQPFRNIIEILNATNETRDCNIEPGIYIQMSDNNEMKIEGGKIILSGDGEHIHTEAIIVRDILSPKWVRVMYGLD